MTTRSLVIDEPGQALPPLVGFVGADEDEALIEAASAMVRGYAGWHVAPVVAETLVVDVGPGHVGAVVLPTLRLRRVLDVRMNGRPITGWTYAPHGVLYVPGTVASTCALEVDVHHGWALEDVPDLAGVVRQVCAVAASSPSGVTREQVGSVSLSFAVTSPGVGGGLALLERDRAIVDTYRIGALP